MLCFSYTCIVCQEEHRQTGEEPAIVLAAFIQRSTVLRWANDQAATEELLPEVWPALVDGGRRIGTHISTCGHVMHFKCWQQHFDSLLGRERRRSYRSVSYLTSDFKSIITNFLFLAQISNNFEFEIKHK